MEKEIILVTLDKMGDVRKKAGQKDSKIKSSAQEFTSIPAKGTFSHVGIKEFDIPNVGKVKSVGLYLTDGSFVSENALNQQNLLSELIEIKNGKRKGKLMLKSERLTDLSEFGASADIRLVTLQGKSFSTTKKPDTRVYKEEFLDADKFDEVCQTSDTKTALKNAMDCTELKNGYVFEIV